MAHDTMISGGTSVRATDETPLERFLDGPLAARPSPEPVLAGVSGAVVGELVALIGHRPMVRAVGAGAQEALTTVDLRPDDVGARVMMVMPAAGERLPVIIGVLRGDPAAREEPVRPVVEVDGEVVVVKASERLVLRCGEASITLTRAGKILIDGHYVSSRATGVNRIKGGSVQIN